MSSSAGPTKLKDAACTVLAVRNKPFAVPRALIHIPTQQGFGVNCEVADSSPGCVSMLITKNPPTDIHQQQQLLEQLQKNSNNSSDEQQQHQQQQHQNLMEPSSMIIQRITTSPKADPISAWRLARYLKLSNLIHPHLCPNILPLIAAYRYQHNTSFISNTAAPTSKTFASALVPERGEEAVYLCQAHMEETLASAARAAPTTLISSNQIRVISRELLDALSILHKNNIVLLDLNPTTVRINVALRSRSDVAICLSRPVLSGVPMKSQNFLKLLDLPKLGHRYLAPEVITQIVNASTSKSNVVSETDIYSLPDSSTITISTASDVWSLGCLLAELALGRPLFPSDSIYDHEKIVSQVLSQPFPPLSTVLNQQVPVMIHNANKFYGASPTSPVAAAERGTNNNSPTQDGMMNQTQRSLNDTLSGTFSGTYSGNQQQQQNTTSASSRSSTSSRIGMFNGIQISSHLLTALNGTENSFKQLIAAMLQVDPALRPSVEDVIKSPFISMGASSVNSSGSGFATRGVGQAGGSSTISGGGGGGGANLGTRVFGGRRNSGTSSNSHLPSGAGVGGKKPTSMAGGNQQQQQTNNNAETAAGGGGRMRSADFPSTTSGGFVFDFGHEWAIPSPTDDVNLIHKEIRQHAPIMP